MCKLCNLPSTLQHEVGRFLGFPDCCIKERSLRSRSTKGFEGNIDKFFSSKHKLFTSKQKEVMQYSLGYSPCKKCAKKIDTSSKKKAIESIITSVLVDRKYILPFPYLEMDHFIEEFEKHYNEKQKTNSGDKDTPKRLVLREKSS